MYQVTAQLHTQLDIFYAVWWKCNQHTPDLKDGKLLVLQVDDAPI